MEKPLKIGTEVYIFYRPLFWNNSSFDIDYLVKGIVTGVEKMSIDRYMYKVKSGENEYSGLYGIPSSLDYAFLTKKDYIAFLKSMLEDLKEQKEYLNDKTSKCRERIRELNNQEKNIICI